MPALVIAAAARGAACAQQPASPRLLPGRAPGACAARFPACPAALSGPHAGNLNVRSQPRRRACGAAAAAASSGGAGGSSELAAAEQLLLAHTAGGRFTLYAASPAVEAAVDVLVAAGAAGGPGRAGAPRPLTDGPTAVQQSPGTWEVFYAPHLRRLTEPFGLRVYPVSYGMGPGPAPGRGAARPPPHAGEVALGSWVRAEGWGGSLWLNASGALWADGPASVRLRFDDFWVGSQPPAQDPQGRPRDGSDTLIGSAISALGRVGFVEPLATFPVLYFTGDLCVFRFPPLASNIAARRRPAAGLMPPQ